MVAKMNKAKSIIAALLIAFGVGTYVGYAKHDDIKKFVNQPGQTVRYVASKVGYELNNATRFLDPKPSTVEYELIKKLKGDLYLVKPNKPVVLDNGDGVTFRKYNRIIIKSKEELPEKGKIEVMQDPFDGGPTGWYPNGQNPIPEFENYGDFYQSYKP